MRGGCPSGGESGVHDVWGVEQSCCWLGAWPADCSYRSGVLRWSLVLWRVVFLKVECPLWLPTRSTWPARTLVGKMLPPAATPATSQETHTTGQQEPPAHRGCCCLHCCWQRTQTHTCKTQQVKSRCERTPACHQPPCTMRDAPWAARTRGWAGWLFPFQGTKSVLGPRHQPLLAPPRAAAVVPQRHLHTRIHKSL